ncbi:MAG: tRNA pseudouridine(55) synthase TruB [Elusimicrobia bacterium]|nr:tRNA pseudouridine(55) synthase TruB [Elusimicrobiota bacterium]
MQKPCLQNGSGLNSSSEFPSSGLILLDKPLGPTSHDAVLWARSILKTKRAGHCGALDPSATGLLLLVVGNAVKCQSHFTSERKTYRGTFRLGMTTDTDDLTGRPMPLFSEEEIQRRLSVLSARDLAEVFRQFTGRIEQRVPRYSAVKVQGQRLYEWARKGISVELPVKTVEIHAFDLLRCTPPEAEFFVECSKGTYIRSLARDIGEKLGVGGVLSSLCRESIGPFCRGGAYRWGGERDIRADDLVKAFIPFQKFAEYGIRWPS